MIESYAAALYESGILDKAAHVLEERLSKEGTDRQALKTLGEIYRKQGRLANAGAVYERVAAADPADRHSTALCSILTGEVPEVWEAPDAAQPAPFVLLENFLPEDFHRSLLPMVLEAPEADIVASTVGQDQYRPDRRVSYTVEGLDEIQRSFWNHIAAALPSLLPRLQVEPFPMVKREVRVRTYRTGNFFEVHRDNSIPTTADRQVSFVYFFHRVPRRYTGGELLLFDTVLKPSRYSITTFTRIVPLDNAIVLFPSRFYHAVVPVQCASSDPGDTRFVINGHVRTEGA